MFLRRHLRRAGFAAAQSQALRARRGTIRQDRRVVARPEGRARAGHGGARKIARGRRARTSPPALRRHDARGGAALCRELPRQAEEEGRLLAADDRDHAGGPDAGMSCALESGRKDPALDVRGGAAARRPGRARARAAGGSIARVGHHARARGSAALAPAQPLERPCGRRSAGARAARTGRRRHASRAGGRAGSRPAAAPARHRPRPSRSRRDALRR